MWDALPDRLSRDCCLQYVMMFAVGVLSGRFNWFRKMNNLTGAASLLLGALLAGGIYAMGDNSWGGFGMEYMNR